VLVFLCASISIHAQEKGGVSGADFLTSAPSVRVNAMGGAIDGLDRYLESIYVNPAGLAPIDRLSFQLAVQPYPNDVTHNQLSFGMPLLGGVIGSSAQLLNAGDFTYINEDLQPEGTVSIYDAAVTVGYSRYVWSSLSLGVSLKTIYRSLGEYTAFAVGGDFGAMYRFETPHLGQRPKPPKRKKLEHAYTTRVKNFEVEREKRTKKALEEVSTLEKEVASVEKQIEELSEKRESTEGEKKQALSTRQEDLENTLDELRLRLTEAEEQSQERIAEIDAWYAEALQTEEEAYLEKLSDLQYVESERNRLFAVIQDPEKELTEEMINDSIDENSTKTETYLVERIAALNEENLAFASIREERIEEIYEEIEFYRNRIAEETGAEIQTLQVKLATLEKEEQRLESSDLQDFRAEREDIEQRIRTTKSEIEQASSDPWIKRLEQRIAEKEREIAELEESIAKKNEETLEAVEEEKKAVRNDMEGFNAARENLLRELKKAKLKRELDLLNAKREKQRKRAIESYEAKERSIYTDLLSVSYTNEENIIQARSAALELSHVNRTYDLETQLRKERERVENDFAFQDRYLSKKIEELEQRVKADETDENAAKELAALQDELSRKTEAMKTELEDIELRESRLLDEADQSYEKSVEELEWQRTITRLVYLQTDDPYLNTTVHASLTNFGTKVTFVEEGYPLPTAAHIGAGYALLNTMQHTVRLGVQFDLPFRDEFALDVGAEYGFRNIVFARLGYTFLTPYRSFSAGIGARVPMGFTDISADYTFQPIPDYGFVHSFGIAASF
jgi:hypothetical protein